MFKKLNLILMSALVFGFTACDDIEDAIPQSYAPEALMSLDGLTVENGAALSGETINLNEVSQLEVIKTVATPELRDGQSVEYVMHVSTNAEFTGAKTLEVTGNSVYASDINTIFRELHGKTDKARDLHVRFAAYLAYGDGARVRFGSQDTYFASAVMSVIPFTPELFIDEVYYLEINGEVRATLSNTGGDVYDNPTFTAKVNIPEENFDEETFSFGVWKVVSDRYKETGDASAGRAVFAPAPESAGQEKGTLVTNTGSSDIPEGDYLAMAGKVVFTINVEKMEFTIAEAPKAYYMIGQFCGWNWDNAAEMIPVNSNPDKYWTIRYVKAGEGFKFNSNTDWDGGQWGYSGAAIGTCVAGEVTYDGDDNLLVAKSGWYIFVVDVSSGAPVLDILEPNVYVFGAAIGNKWSAEEDNKFTVIDDPDAEWPFVSPDVTATDGTDSSCLRLCVQLPGHEWWHTEFVFYSDGNIVYRGTGGDQARTGNDAGKIYLNFVTNKGKVE